jgi:hypothetical protein
MEAVTTIQVGNTPVIFAMVTETDESAYRPNVDKEMFLQARQREDPDRERRLIEAHVAELEV